MGMIKLTTVHDALQSAAFKKNQNNQMISASCKIDQKTKDLADGICEKHATTLSAFLRECCESLVLDYTNADISNSNSNE